MFMVSLLVQSTVFFGSRGQNKTADNKHLCLDTEVRQDGSLVTQRPDLCGLTEQAGKPAVLADFLVLNDPHNFFYPLAQIPGIFYFFSNKQYFILPVVLYLFPLPQHPLHHHPGSSSGMNGFQYQHHSVQHPSAPPWPHMTIAPLFHPPIYLILHDLGAKNRKGSFTTIWNAISVIN